MKIVPSSKTNYFGNFVLNINLGRCCRANDENAFEADFGAFDFPIPNLTLPSSIGNGLHFVSKFLTSRFSGKRTKTQPIVDYLISLNHGGEVSGKTT